MSDLAEYQRQFATALLGSAGDKFALATHPAIDVHRNTVFSGLHNALALSFPTVIKLTGPEYFETLVREFARQHPPRSAVLYGYGAELPAFLATFPGAERFPYFGDVARFDWAVDQIAHTAPGRYANPVAVPGGRALRLPVSLSCARFDFAVDLIRDAVESEHDGALQEVDANPTPRWLVLWRGATGTSLKPVSAVSWHILDRLAHGCDAESALASATDHWTASEVLGAWRFEIRPSSFVRFD